MANLELYRTFVAVYRSGSISGAARSRHLTQPAVSQQIAALEALVGAPLFQRTPKGVVPTGRGQDLYAQIFDPLDRLERVSRSLAGRDSGDAAPVRFGAPAEYFECFALERLAGAGIPLIVSFGEGRDLLAQLESGGLDAVVSTVRPTQRTLQHQVLGDKHYALIGPPGLEIPAAVDRPEALGAWLNARPWVSYSAELPITRRFWQHHLGARFDAALSLVAPDLRAVLRAVELGYGVSILPEFLCRAAIQAGRVREVWPVRRLIPAEQWVLAFREVDSERPAIRLLGQRLAAPELPPEDETMNIDQMKGMQC